MVMRTVCGVATLLVFLTGCKIEITVPPNGEVLTLSGDAFCTAESTCVVEVEDTQFDQTFVARPASGYRFVGWKQGEDYMCGGTTDPCRLRTSGIGNNPGLLAVLQSDQAFFLEPMFERTVDACAANLNNGAGNRPDFDGDGYADLAIGAPDLESLRGSVSVIHGTPDGLRAKNNQKWSIAGGVESDTNRNLGNLQGVLSRSFGGTLATADFNGDGYSDVAVGAPDEPYDTRLFAGGVHIVYGSSTGLNADGNQLWRENQGWADADGTGQGVPIGPLRYYPPISEETRFGSSLAAGDLNADGYADLAIGAWQDDVNGDSDAGSVQILLGSHSGLTAEGSQIWSQDGGIDDQGNTLGDLQGGTEEGDAFGRTLAMGDFDNDGYEDLAIGAPGEGVGSIVDAGMIHIVRGSPDGLTALGNQIWHEGGTGVDDNGDGMQDRTLGIPGINLEAGDSFGGSLATGDFNGDAIADLALGSPLEDDNSGSPVIADTGVVRVFYGSAQKGLTVDGGDYIRQYGLLGENPVAGSDPEARDRFGFSLQSGDFNRDGFGDLAIGAPGESFSSTGNDVGSVNVFFGSDSGLDGQGHQWISQNLMLLEDGSNAGDLLPMGEASDFFGYSLTAADYNNDGFDELVIGIPALTALRAGSVSVVPGGCAGLTAVGNQLWSLDGGRENRSGERNDPGDDLGDLLGTGEPTDHFGEGLP